MRITHGMLSTRLLADLRRMDGDVAASQRQVATGKRITRAGDDPTGSRAAVLQRGELTGTARFKQSVSEATGFVETTDKALGSLADLLSRVRELSVQGANGTATTADRTKIAAEIDQLIASAKDAANAKFGGQYVLSGTATTTPPYAPGSDAYAGDGAAVIREIGPGVTVRINQTGSTILGSGQGAGDGLLLDALRDVADHLRGGTAADVQALRTTDLQALETNLDTISQARATNGALASRLEAASVRLDDLELAGTTRLSQIEDVDVAKAILDLSSRQTAYQAAMQSGASVIQRSLMDFLR
jgi:flagellar hook-associated protein 3 FlgL